MERYQRVVKPKPEQPVNENEIRVTAQGLIRNYVTYATSLFQVLKVESCRVSEGFGIWSFVCVWNVGLGIDGRRVDLSGVERESFEEGITSYMLRIWVVFPDKENDKNEKEVVLKAMGQAISKAVAIGEIIKNRIPGLHQNISTSSTTITDAYEPIEEGLNPLEMRRQVSLISIALSTIELNKTSPGYQAPTVKQVEGRNQQELENKQSIVSSTAVGEAGDIIIGELGGNEAEVEAETGDTVGQDTKEAEVMVEEEAEVTATAEEGAEGTATAMVVNEEAGGTAAMVEEEAVATEVEGAGATVEGAGVIKNS
ncbi:hypothetical protein SASPL_146027 [Salvia splendens]|uniref:DNA/RNA-binding protein Alba-like domain-containing protein n=1 Tax=Salvia splendens TaxID=180675 RepID=A0A8X8Z8W7_SALSN|nr:hypothetical protein SASPL_146027 [Salvia splendens]